MSRHAGDNYSEIQRFQVRVLSRQQEIVDLYKWCISNKYIGLPTHVRSRSYNVKLAILFDKIP